MEHGPDCERHEQEQFYQLQEMVHGRRLKPVNWAWLDKVEDERWGEKPEQREVPEHLTQKNMLALARAGKFVPQSPN